MNRSSLLFGNLYCFCHQFIACSRSKSSWQFVLASIIRICACTHGNHHIHHIYIILQSACRTNTDNLLHIIKIVQLIAVNTHRRHTHTASHYRNLLSLISSGISKHISYGIKAHRILQISFCNIFRTKRISRHQNLFCNISFFCSIVWCWNRHNISSFSLFLSHYFWSTY